MLTNTQKLLYTTGYYPVYAQRTDLQTTYNGYGYKLTTFEEVKTDGVWKVELENGLVSYFSDCNIFLNSLISCNIKDLVVGDSVLTHYPAIQFQGKQTRAKMVYEALVYKKKIKEVCDLYKIDKLSRFKLLANNIEFIGDFLCYMVKKNSVSFQFEYTIVKTIQNYELLQELILAFSLIGVKTSIKRVKGRWQLFIPNQDFLKVMTDNITYKNEQMKVAAINYIKQDTQSFRVTPENGNLVVNSIVVKGD